MPACGNRTHQTEKAGIQLASVGIRCEVFDRRPSARGGEGSSVAARRKSYRCTNVYHSQPAEAGAETREAAFLEVIIAARRVTFD